MASMEDLKKKLEKLKSDIEAALPDIATEMTITAANLARNNIKKKGFGAQYSENKIPAWLMEGKELNGKGKKFIDDAVKSETEINWKELRNAQGLPTDHVNLSYSNKMLSALEPLPPYWKSGKIIAPLGAGNVEAQNKLNWNRDRYGNFFSKVLGKVEVTVMRKVVFDRVSVIFEKNGFKKN
jgi:hypothetical protein